MANKTWVGTLTGVQDWSVAANWTPSGAPATGDAVFILSGNANIESGLSQSGVTLASRFVGPSFAGTIGSATTPLSIGITSDTIDPSAVTRVNANYGTVAVALTILSGSGGQGGQGGQAADAGLGLEQIRVQGSNASNVLFMLGGQLGMATNATGDTAQFPAISILGNTSVFKLASGCTLSVLTQEAGTGMVGAALPTLTQEGAQSTLTTYGTGALGATACTISGTVISNSTGNVSNVTIRGTGTLDFNQSPTPRTSATAIQMYSGATLNANKLWMTLTGGFVTAGCKLDDVTVDTGTGRTYTVS